MNYRVTRMPSQFQYLKWLTVVLVALSWPISPALANMAAVCNLNKSGCECSYENAFARMLRATKISTWRLVESAGASQAKSAIKEILADKNKISQNKEGIPDDMASAGARIPTDSNKISKFQQGKQGIIFFGKGSCLVSVVRVSPIGIFVMTPIRYFLAPF